jgi:FtsP/CotA-like multicopper oxidase with cupredoxin domain
VKGNKRICAALRPCYDRYLAEIARLPDAPTIASHRLRTTAMAKTRRIAFDADNPGRWVFHCHNLYHMATGMMTEFRYEDIAA